MAYTKDQRIVNENPTLTAYQLLTEKGLSQEKYDELVKEGYQPKITPPTPERIQPEVKKWADVKAETPKTAKWADVKAKPSIRPMAKTQPYQSPVQGNSQDQAYLINKQTGKQLYMSKNQALRMKRKYPAIYDVR
jgi:hypothetical protein